jgi:hypothetical protein
MPPRPAWMVPNRFTRRQIRIFTSLIHAGGQFTANLTPNSMQPSYRAEESRLDESGGTNYSQTQQRNRCRMRHVVGRTSRFETVALPIPNVAESVMARRDRLITGIIGALRGPTGQKCADNRFAGSTPAQQFWHYFRLAWRKRVPAAGKRARAAARAI